MRKSLAALLGLFLLCSGSFSFAADEYLLGPGDLLKISVYGNPDMTTEARVSESGTITFPLLGEIRVDGIGKQAVEGKLAQLLQRDGYLKNAQINVLVTEFVSQQVSILGYVARPGKYAIAHARKLTDILAMAGGINADGGDFVTVIQNQGKETRKTDISLNALFETGGPSQNLTLAGGNIVYVPRASTFYIYGEVQRPGMYRLTPGMTVMQALAVGGGLTPRGTERGVKVTRRNTAGNMEILSARLIDSLRQDDVVYVKESLF